MLRILLVYGLISGLVIIGTIIAGFSLGFDHTHAASMWFGYLVMLIALSLIFVAVRQYRERELGGVIRFGTAFQVGLGIAVVAGVAYVAVWEVYLAATDYSFMQEYTAAMIEQQRAAGASETELQAVTAQMAEMHELYSKPLIRVGMTFLEIFPVGLLVALIAATVMRNSKARTSLCDD